MTLDARWRVAALAAAASIVACPQPPSPVRNIKVATYNAAHLVWPVGNDDDYFDADGQPLSNRERAGLVATNVLAGDVDVIAFNEVFDDDARDELVQRLKGAYPYYVAYIGNDSDVSDSGLMLFSRFEFEKMQLGSRHVYECGDVEIGYGGQESECSEQRLGFVEFDCASEYDGDGDCLASKGVGLVKVAMPIGRSLYVGFSHFLASYPEDGDTVFPELVPCAKKRDRQKALREFQRLLQDAVDEDTGVAINAYVVLLGDLNINGNPFKVHGSACLDSEWRDAFSATGEVDFTTCADQDRQTCIDGDRVLAESWRFTTSPDDLGRTNGFDFALDLGDESRRDEGERLDYVLVRGPVVSDPSAELMIPQHLTVEYPIAGELGELSDHLPIAANLLLPELDSVFAHATPREARSLALPAGASTVQAAMQITIPGQMQWLRFEGRKGTYTFLTSTSSGTPVGLDVYAPSDLSRPIEPRRAGNDGGFVYVLNQPPYFLRAFVARASDPTAHDRTVTTSYDVTAHRHDCTSHVQPCILTAGEDGESVVEVTWPASNPVNAEDAMWFEFYADDPSGPQPATFHDFAVYTEASLVTLPEFAFEVVDFTSQTALPNVDWERTTWHVNRRERRATGIVGRPGQMPSFDNHLLKVLRPAADLGYGGTVKVFHGTNLAYFTPLTLRIEQEEDDSAHDELRIYLKDDNTDEFYKTANYLTIHAHASKFRKLPEIDELEDGGSPWPAKSLGTLRLTDELPIVLIEDDDEDGDDEPGDYLLALPDPGNGHQAWNGFALGPLPLGETGGYEVWRWTDDPSESDPDDTSYDYRLSFELTHCPPSFTCDG